ncbi:hypothetical protein EVAR_801_1 [Eumeta japonica]|uniref:Uncharacterized protein n=1 Tax=Eumeta variegata TaxID=151549 RepID=A0A4C1SCY0_EUMVA|nr:hypothetical protein EVAR_801_1 [Eumeta japonica]
MYYVADVIHKLTCAEALRKQIFKESRPLPSLLSFARALSKSDSANEIEIETETVSTIERRDRDQNGVRNGGRNRIDLSQEVKTSKRNQTSLEAADDRRHQCSDNVLDRRLNMFATEWTDWFSL